MTVEERTVYTREVEESIAVLQGASGLLDVDAAMMVSSLLAPEWAGFSDPTISSKTLLDAEDKHSRSAPLERGQGQALFFSHFIFHVTQEFCP